VQSSFKKTSKILDGDLLLYVLADSKRETWYARFRDPTGKKTYVRRSLKTSSLAIATKRAMDLWNEANVRAFLDAPEEVVTWGTLFSRYVVDFSAPTRKNAISLNKRYWNEYFGSLKDLYKIDTGSIISYFHHRCRYWENRIRDGANQTHGVRVSIQALIRERTLLRKLLTRAHNDKLIHQVPDFPTNGDFKGYPNVLKLALKDRRKRFKDITCPDGKIRSEYSLLVAPVLKQIPFESKKTSVGYGGRQTRYSQFNLYVWLFLISNTGLRPMEARQLRFRDFKIYKDPETDELFTTIEISASIAKTGIRRLVVARDKHRTHDRLEKWKTEYEIFWGETPSPDDLVFPNLKDRAVPRNMFPSVRYFHRKLGIHSEVIQGKAIHLTSYSYRSLYITMRLKEGVDVFSVSRNVGTSVGTLERYYDTSSNLDHRKVLTQQLRSLDAMGVRNETGDEE
jgi:integrase